MSVQKQVSHVLIDCVSAFNGPGNNESWVRSVAVAVPRLKDVGAFQLVETDSGDLSLDIGPLVGSSSALLNWLIEGLTEVTGLDRDVIISKMREWVDEG